MNRLRSWGRGEAKRPEDSGECSKGMGLRRGRLRKPGVPSVRDAQLYARSGDCPVTSASRTSHAVASTAPPISKGGLRFAASGEWAEGIGNCAGDLGNKPANGGGDILLVTGSEHEALYSAHLLNAPVTARLNAHMAQGDVFVHNRPGHLAVIEVPFSPFPDQRPIHAVLSIMDAYITAFELGLDTTRTIGQGLILQLLSGCCFRRTIPQSLAEGGPSA